MPEVCKFYLQGRCRYGDKCRYIHPKQPAQSTNRFAALQSPVNDVRSGQRSSPFGSGSSTDNVPSYLNKDNIIKDLNAERPQWILSAYAPGRDAPVQLLEGPREQSFEEMRLHHYTAAAAGNTQIAVQEAQSLFNHTEQQIRNVLNDIDGAVNYLREGANKHPNRIDICKQSTGQVTVAPAQSSGAFGQPTGSAFGRPSLPATGAAFGQPSSLGQTAPAFGQPSQPGPGPNPFARPSQATTNSSPFAQATQSQPNSNPFGQTPSSGSGFGTQPGTTAFGQPSQPERPSFGAPSQPAPSTFGTPTAQASNNPFASPAAQQQQTRSPFSSSPFNTGSTSQPTSVQGNVFGGSQGATPSGANPFASASSDHDRPPRAESARNASGMLTAWKGKPVSYIDGEPCYRRNDGAWERIWFPDGPPPYNKDTKLPLEMYDERTTEAYKHLLETGTFKDGWMPELPPRRDWCRWDF